MIRKIGLAVEEQALYDIITWDPQGPEQCSANGEIIERLIGTLRDRIPQSRKDMLTKAEFNPGGRGHGFLDRFSANAGGIREMYSHPSFLRQLHYLIEGPHIPATFATAFDMKVKDLAGNHRITSSDVEPLRVETRRLVRAYRLMDPDQVYRLAAEYVPHVMNIDYAMSIRKAAQDAMRR